MTSLSAFKEDIEKRLFDVGIEEAELDARLLISEATGIEQIDFALDGARILTDAELVNTEKLVAKRLKRIPMSQIFGEKEFWSLSFKVTKDTLTPRPDSETLIEAALKSFDDKSNSLKILDLGTGTGCLLLSLLSEFKNACGVGIDASEAALNVAKENAISLELNDRSDFITSDWFSVLPKDKKFDIIISNPPYIGLVEKPSLSPEVKDHEPETALFAGEEGLDDYKKIASGIDEFLAEDGIIILEIGYTQAIAVSEIFKAEGFSNITVFKDLGGRDRALKISKK